MEFLYWLEGLRNPVCDFFFRWLTELGGETVFMVAAITVFWCVNKKWGYYIFTVGFFGTVLNQFLKLVYRIPRPWVVDEKFTIVEAARSGATGYSFPSGHTQNAVGTFGGLALCARKRWPKWAIGGLLALVVLVPFSRMYLGVHTPLDVGVAFGCAAVLLLAFYPLVMKSDEKPVLMYLLFGGMLACMAAYICYVNIALNADMFRTYEGEIDNYTDGVKNGWTLTGAMLGLLVTYVYDTRVLRFDVRATPIGQVLKLALGLTIVIAIRLGLSKLFSALLPGQAVWNLPRYFLMTVFAGCIWPHSFPFWSRLGEKKEA